MPAHGSSGEQTRQPKTYKELVSEYKDYTIYATDQCLQYLLVALTVIFAILAIALLASWDVDKKNVDRYDHYTCEVQDRRYQYYTCADLIDCSCSGCLTGMPSCSVLTVLPNTTSGSLRCCGAKCCAKECCDECCAYDDDGFRICKDCDCECCQETNQQCTQLYGQCGNIFVLVKFGKFGTKLNYTENCFFRDQECFSGWNRFKQESLPCWYNGAKLKFDEPDVNEHVMRAGLAFAALLCIMIMVWFIQPAVMYVWFAHKHRFVYYNEQAMRYNAETEAAQAEYNKEQCKFRGEEEGAQENNMVVMDQLT